MTEGFVIAEPEPLLPEADLLVEEAAAVARRRASLKLGPASTHGIGVCFSGGGLRAASFDCGVLWKLGELGLLKDVDHLSAVSGGGYTGSAYVSHVAAQDGAPSPDEADGWYGLAVAQLITRMQDNIGYLVTTSHSLLKSPGKQRGGAYGRIFDVPAFMAVLIGMPIGNVLTFIIFWAMPLASFINLNHGHSMRAYLCSKTSDDGYQWFPGLALFGCITSFFLWMCLKVVDNQCPVRTDPPRHERWLVHQCSKIFLSRLALISLVYGVLVVGAMAMQQYDYGRANSYRDVKCACAKFYGWNEGGYNWSSYDDYRDYCGDANPTPLSNNRSFAGIFVVVVAFIFAITGLLAALGAPALLGLVARIVGPLIGILGVAYVAEWRVFGPVTHQRFVWRHMAYNAKLWSKLFFTSCALAIANLPSQHELPRTLHRFYARSLRRAFFAHAEDVPLTALRDDFSEDAFGVRPTENDARVNMPTGSPMHERGAPQLIAEAASPNLILGATINEFRRPEDPSNRAQMFVLTPRAWGGKHTGYARPPRWLSLSRAMAISGAAIDGFVLSKFQSKALRMALQVFNLTMGDTIRFSGVYDDDDDARVKVTAPLAAAVEVVEAPFGMLCGRRDDELAPKYQLRRRERVVEKHISCCSEQCEGAGAGIRIGDSLATDELASTLYSRRYEMLLFSMVYVSFMVSAAFYSKSDDKQPFLSTPAPALAGVAVMIMGIAVAASMYSFLSNVRFLLASVIIQQVHLLLQVTHFGNRAPPATTLTDGGLTECIGVVELLRRRTRWIIAVDTTEDPGISMLYLKESFDVAKQQGLVDGEITDAGSPFLDEAKPTVLLSYDDLLSPEIQLRKYARLKVKYPDPVPKSAKVANAPDFAAFADVFVVKMRKISQDPRKCVGLITPDQIADSVPGLDKNKVPPPLLDVQCDPLNLNQNEINGLCCECCHANCSCLPCGELPFLSVGNQFLTPFQFATLCRLARDLADAPINEIKRARAAM